MRPRYVLALNRVVPFRTRLTEGVLHLRAFAADASPTRILVAEFDWALQVADPAEAYQGAGIWNYPGYALPAARAAVREAALEPPDLEVVRMPGPAGERYERVVHQEDPQGWEPVTLEWIRGRVPPAQVDAFPAGQYTRARIERWIAAGAPALDD